MVNLTIDEAVNRAIEKNLTLASQRLTPRTFDYSIAATLATYRPTLTSLFSRWTDILGGATMTFSPDVPPGSPALVSLNIPWTGGGVSSGGHLYKLLSPGVDDTLYLRYYIKYPSSGNFHHSGIWMGGFNPSSSWPDPQAGVKPVGNDRFIAAAEQNNVTNLFDRLFDQAYALPREGRMALVTLRMPVR